MFTKIYSKIDFNCMGVLSCCFFKHSKLPAMKFAGLNVCDVNGSGLLLYPSDLGAEIFVSLFIYVWESEGGVDGFSVLVCACHDIGF